MGERPPMTSGYQGHDIADTFGRGWSLKGSIPIRVHSWFAFKNDRQFLPRMIRPVVGGLTCLKPIDFKNGLVLKIQRLT